jgi:hypothetical protein
MTKFTIEESPSAFHPPYREIIFHCSERGHFFNVFEDHKLLYASSFYKDQDDCTTRGVEYLSSLHQEKPLLQEQKLPSTYQVRMTSSKRKPQNNE